MNRLSSTVPNGHTVAAGSSQTAKIIIAHDFVRLCRSPSCPSTVSNGSMIYPCGKKGLTFQLDYRPPRSLRVNK